MGDISGGLLYPDHHQNNEQDSHSVGLLDTDYIVRVRAVHGVGRIVLLCS